MRRVPAGVGAAIVISACVPVVTAPPPPPPPLVGAFITTVGPDTLHVERFERRPNLITGRTLFRAPVAAVRDYRYDYRDDGSIARLEFLTRPADLASDTITGRVAITFTGDTAVVESGIGESARVQWVPSPPADVALAGGIALAHYEYAAQRAPAAVGDSAVLRMYFPAILGGTQPLLARRIAPDTVEASARSMGTVHMAFDSAGHMIEFDGRGSGLSFVSQRLDDIDIDSVVRAFTSREGGGSLGLLSPRDTVFATVHGAQFMLDYGRPSVRGREIFGTVVPWGRVWRLGANQATHFRTERDVVIGGLTVPAGLYTLWVMPAAEDRWQLIINRETGQWGTMYDPARDLGRVPLTVRRLNEPVEQLTITLEARAVGGMLLIQWDTYEASVPFSPR